MVEDLDLIPGIAKDDFLEPVPVEIVIENGLEGAGDATLVKSLLSNLIGNAWKFTARFRDAPLA